MDEDDRHITTDTSSGNDEFHEGVMIEGIRLPLTGGQRLRRVGIASLAIACVLVVVFWPTISALRPAIFLSLPMAQATATPRTSVRIIASSGWSQSSAQCPVTSQTPSSTGSPEMHADSYGSGDIWALLLTDPPLSAHSAALIMWRATGSGAFHVIATGPGVVHLEPVNGPYLQPGGDRWQRPGDEWITNFIFPEAGCWQLQATRGTSLAANIWLEVSA